MKMIAREDAVTNTAIVVVDFINDYAHTGGKACCPGAGDKLDEIQDLLRKCGEQEHLVVFANNTRKKNDIYHPESKLFVDHALEDSWGRMIYKDLDKQCESERIKFISVDKPRYSIFAGTSLDQKLRERKIENLIIVGTGVEHSILHSVIDAYDLGYNVTVLEDLVTYSDENFAFMVLAHIQRYIGGKTMTKEVYLNGGPEDEQEE
jgi:nicotinamidase-related amidase